MKRTGIHLFVFFFLAFLTLNVTNAIPPGVNCLKVKIFTKDKTIAFTDRHKFVIHFQLENCSNINLPIDFYGNLGYPTDSSCNIYFEITKADAKGRYTNYSYLPVDYKNVVDSIIQLKPHKIYSFYLPLFQVYGIKEPGAYRIQGFYRFINEANEYFIQRSDYLDILIK